MAMMGSDGTGICSVYARAGPVGQQQQQQQRLPAGHEKGILYQRLHLDSSLPSHRHLLNRPPPTLLKVSSFNLFRLVYFRSHLHCSHCGDLLWHGGFYLATRVEFVSSFFPCLSDRPDLISAAQCLSIVLTSTLSLSTTPFFLFLFTLLSKNQLILIVHSLWSAFNRTSIDIESFLTASDTFPSPDHLRQSPSRTRTSPHMRFQHHSGPALP